MQEQPLQALVGQRAARQRSDTCAEGGRRRVDTAVMGPGVGGKLVRAWYMPLI